ncbi:hypothetical protein F8S09_06815 [Deinococcus sp. SDU3-2]|uniref:Carboxypeptidase regulatory-like domain-containing protein n=1 Tax=Deinococcus terrestris TaxID=2651870 RepID=A0A7X1NV72_9DEIO|nr:hypothetical protein [Deinococcus terrestris]MPY66407.1 hypothetical protein [Deinococcus terrestris]
MKNAKLLLLVLTLTAVPVCGGAGSAVAAQSRPSPSPTSPAAATPSGTWSGKLDGWIDAGATLTVRGDRVTGTFVLAETPYPLEGTWTAASRRLTFSFRRAAGTVTVQGTVKDGGFSGTYSLNGASGPVALHRAASTSNPPGNAVKPAPYVMTGVVRNSAGQPVPAVKVFADNTLYHNMNALGTTDAQGRYRIELPREVGTWRPGAYVSHEYGGETWTLRVYADEETAFDARTGAVRDFTWRLTGKTSEGLIGGTVWIHPQYGGVDYDTNDVELTLTPDGPLVDGSVGRAIT